MSIFSTIPVKKVKRTKFDLSHEKKLSLKMGKLYPVLLQEVLPSDSFKVNSQVFLRFAPMIAPVMERFYCNIHFFFVPNRLVWESWKDFITGGEDGTLEPTLPTLAITDGNKGSYGKGSLFDYMGIPEPPDTVDQNIVFSAIPFRAYNLIYNEYYRDQNLEDPVDINSGAVGDYQIRSRSWKKDYFTSALPFAQRGQEVTLPFDDINYSITSSVIRQDSTPADGPLNASTGILQDGTSGARIENIESIGAPTINELRKAYRLQEWLENNARGGARYIEQIMAHFNQRSSDSRLQRPEYLGGGKTDVVISEVLNTAGIIDTAGEDSGGYQGRMAGHGVSLGSTNAFKRRFEEHGYIFGIMSVMSYPTYFQGLHRHFSRFDKLDYAFPEFANLGEQEILNQELYVQGTEDDQSVFGYTPRYAEYKYQPSSIHGDFKDNLLFWNYAQKFENAPGLNTDFVHWNNDNRIFNVDDQEIDNVYAHIKHNVSAIRPLPYFGVPRT